MCGHEKIQVIRKGRAYVWSCALCGDEMLIWDRLVWDKFMGDMPSLAEGEGFTFNIVKRGSDEDIQNSYQD